MFRAAHGLIATTVQSAPRARLCRAASVAEAVAALAEPGSAAVAGGTDLCAQYNAGGTPALLVCLAGLNELRGISITPDAIRIGALTTHAQGSRDAGLRAALPGFADAWGLLANPRVRHRATIGGNLMARHTRYEMSLLLTALEARLIFAGDTHAPAGIWDQPTPGLLTHIIIPRRRSQRFVYMRGLRPQLTLALHRHASGGAAAIATEWLRPQPIAMDDSGLETLPETFTDHVISHWYARRAGAALLARGMEALNAA
jgi:carbon-monoxide dehydrogenase medium subunit